MAGGKHRWILGSGSFTTSSRECTLGSSRADTHHLETTPSIRNLKNLYKNEDHPNFYFDVVPFEEIVNRYREPASIFKKVKSCFNINIV